MNKLKIDDHEEIVQIIEKSGLFDETWYMNNYRDVKLLDMSPIEHFVKFGGVLGRRPNPDFNTKFYTSYYPDVKVLQ